jgi:ribosomal protein L28/predicted cupin superfamily sugar epimerase
MKKITFILILMFSSLGFSQVLPFNFSSPSHLMSGQEGTTTSRISDAGNDVLQIVGGTALYDHATVILAQNVNLADDANNTITFRIKSNVAAQRSHLLKFEQGVGGPATTELGFTTTGTEWQNISLNFPAGLGNYAKIVLFTDFNNTLTGTYTIDDFAGGTNVAASVLTQMSLPVTFDSTTVDYGLISFGGTESTVVVDPTLSTNKVAKVVKPAGETWAGTTISGAAGLGFSPAIPFTATERKMNVRVWSPTAGTTVRLKVEVSTNAAQSVEADAVTTVANGWQTLEFNFNNQATGTAAFNAAFPYNKASIFFNFNVVGSGQTYYFDDLKFGAAVVAVLTQMSLPVTFDSTTVDYGLISFGGTVSTLVVDPTLSTNNVAKVVKPAGETWAGTTISGAAGLGFSPAIPFTATERKMNVRVWSPTAGTTVRLKVEVSTNAAQSVEADAVTTVANGWQTLEFNFNNQATGTAAFNAAFPYNKATIFFNFNVVGSGQTYYFDDLKFGATVIVLTQMSLPVTFDSTTVDYGLISFGGTASTLVVDPTLSTNNVAKVVKPAGETWAGTTVTNAAGQGFSPAIPFTATERKMNVRVWSPTAGTTVRLKVEVSTNAAQSVEADALTTVANGWQTLEFNFNNQATGTAAFNAAFPYNKASIFFNFNVVGSGQTYYFDDMKFGASLGLSSFEASKVKMYPNPTSSVFTIEANEVIESVSLYNVLGQEVVAKNPNSNVVTLDIANLQTGVYVVKTMIGGVSSTSRIVKR